MCWPVFSEKLQITAFLNKEKRCHQGRGITVGKLSLIFLENKISA